MGGRKIDNILPCPRAATSLAARTGPRSPPSCMSSYSKIPSTTALIQLTPFSASHETARVNWSTSLSRGPAVPSSTHAYFILKNKLSRQRRLHSNPPFRENPCSPRPSCTNSGAQSVLTSHCRFISAPTLAIVLAALSEGTSERSVSPEIWNYQLTFSRSLPSCCGRQAIASLNRFSLLTRWAYKQKPRTKTFAVLLLSIHVEGHQ